MDGAVVVMMMVVVYIRIDRREAAAELNRFAVFGVQIGAPPVFLRGVNLPAVGNAEGGEELFERGQPLAIIGGVGVFALALRIVADLGAETFDPLFPGEDATPAQLNGGRERFSLPGFREGEFLVAGRCREVAETTERC